MKNEFIPYEQALELKELGFDEICFTSYNNNNLVNWWEDPEWVQNSELAQGYITAPTFSQAFRWFREKYNTTHEILRKEDNNHKEFIAWVYIEGARIDVVSYWFSTSYEEAELECLKKLIQIVK
jgi:hypothetical protein